MMSSTIHSGLLTGPVFRFAERLDDAEALECFLLLLDGGFLADLRAQLGGKRRDVDLLQEALDRLAADLGDEPPLVGRLEVVVVLRQRREDLEELLFGDQVLLLQSGRSRD